MKILLHKLEDSKKKYRVVFEDGTSVSFGASRYSDYSQHQDERRKASYLKRHEANEDWTEEGIKTAGFWARWLLWNKPTIAASVKDIRDRFGVKIVRKRG